MKKILMHIIIICLIISLSISNTISFASEIIINDIKENNVSNEVITEEVNDIKENFRDEDNNVNNIEKEQIGKVEQLKTGDIPIILFRILLIVSLLGIIIVLIKKKNRHKPKRHKPKRQKPKQKKKSKKRKVQNKNIRK